MGKHVDSWDEIASLICKDKEKALADFNSLEFAPSELPEICRAGRSFRLPVRRPVFLAAVASLLLVIGLVSFWLWRSSRSKVPAAPELDSLLANSFLYGSSHEPKQAVSETRTASSFSPALSIWITVAGLNRATAPAAESADPPASIECGNPEKVRQKIGKVIQESSIERMLTQFCQICKEV